jgi:hypothetical protein
MRLRPDEWEALAALAAQARAGTLEARGEQELRFILSKGYRRAPSMSLEELLHAARLLLGYRRIRRWVEEASQQSADVTA